MNESLPHFIIRIFIEHWLYLTFMFICGYTLLSKRPWLRFSSGVSGLLFSFLVTYGPIMAGEKPVFFPIVFIFLGLSVGLNIRAFLLLSEHGFFKVNLYHFLNKTIRETLQDKLLTCLISQPEKNKTIQEMRDFLDSHDSLANQLVYRTALQIIRKSPKAISRETLEQPSSRQMALLAIDTALSHLLPSGEFHTYRGSLGTLGLEMKKLWAATITELEKNGAYNAEEANIKRQWMDKQISKAG